MRRRKVPLRSASGLQRLAQIVTGGCEKTALALIGAVGEFARGALRGSARHDQFGLHALAVGHVANGGRDRRVRPISSMGLKLISTGNSVPSRRRPNSSRPAPIGTHPHVADIVLTVPDMAGTEALRHQLLDDQAHDFIVRVSEQGGNLSIGKLHDACAIDDDHGVWGGVEHTPRELRRSSKHCSDPLICTVSDKRRAADYTPHRVHPIMDPQLFTQRASLLQACRPIRAICIDCIEIVPAKRAGKEKA